jgi:hypothetical protein
MHFQQGNRYRGFVDCAQTIMREEGAGAFLKVNYNEVEMRL